MMQTASKGISIWKTVSYVFAIMGLFTFVLIPILHSVLLGFQTGNWKPSIDSSLGLLFNTEKNLQDDINILLSPLRDNFPRKFIDHIKSDIVFNLLIMAVWFIIFYWLYSKITKRLIGEQVLNFALLIVIVLMALFTIALMIFLYPLIMPPHDFVIPFKSIWELAWNPSIWAVIGSDVGIGSLFSEIVGSPIEAKDFTVDKPFDYNQIVEKGSDNVDLKVNILGRPKKTVEFYCNDNAICISYFGNDNAKCEMTSGICYI